MRTFPKKAKHSSWPYTERQEKWQRRVSGLLVPSGASISLATGLIVGACGGSVGVEMSESDVPVSSGAAGAIGHAGGASGGRSSLGVAGRPSIGVGGTLSINLPKRCTERAPEVFADQALRRPAFRKVLYSWTTVEQIAEIREQNQLFTRTERPGAGPGYAMVALEEYSKSDSPGAPLARKLRLLFDRARYAWHNPWATRLGWPGEDYGNQLIRIELKADAWIAYFDGTSPIVTTAAGELIPDDVAIANFDKVGVIFFERGTQLEGPWCDSFAIGGNGYREFIVGNPDMVEAWSIGTDEIRTRLTRDIEKLTEYLEYLRRCRRDNENFNANVVCWWRDQRWAVSRAALGFSSYEESLAIPSSFYEPTPENITRLIDTLKKDLTTLIR